MKCRNIKCDKELTEQEIFYGPEICFRCSKHIDVILIRVCDLLPGDLFRLGRSVSTNRVVSIEGTNISCKALSHGRGDRFILSKNSREIVGLQGKKNF